MSQRYKGATRTPLATEKNNRKSFRKRYITAAAISSMIVFGVFSMPSKEATSIRTELKLPSQNQDNLLPSNASKIINTDVIADDTVVDISPSATITDDEQTLWQDVEIKSGDNLSLIFNRAGLDARQVHHFVSGNSNASLLKNIYPGQTLSFLIENNQLQSLRYNKNQLSSLIFTRHDDKFESKKIDRIPDVVVKQSHATINSSLALDGEKAGLTQGTIMELANIFGGVLDFALDPRKGDSFTVLYEELYLDGEPYGTGKILAAEYINAGEKFQAFRYIDSKGDAGYYNENGISMQKTFLRAPLDFTRISSSFNPNRVHPLFKTKRPHRGIDYAAPRGTPIWAAGAGRVIASSYNKANGNYVFIQHGEAYVTKYLHLTKRFVKKGQRVKQKQTIGTLGSTGYATGPHLHYEFVVNGVHRNPRTILKKLPKAKSLSTKELANFKTNTAQVAMQLDIISSQYAGLKDTDANNG